MDIFSLIPILYVNLNTEDDSFLAFSSLIKMLQ